MEKLVIQDVEFVYDNEYETYTNEMSIWQKQVPVYIDIQYSSDSNEEVVRLVQEKINWLNENKILIIDEFMEENGHYVDFVNEMIEKGKFKAETKITDIDFRNSIYINSVSLNIKGEDTNFTVDLVTQPDYLFGHCATMEVDSEYTVENGGING